MNSRRSVFALFSGPRAKWVVLAVWVLGIFIAAGPAQLPTKFTDAENNESTSFLPEDAESTKALAASEALQGGELAPAVIVYRRESGLTPEDRRRIADDARKLTAKRFPAVVADGATAAAGGGEGGSPSGSSGGARGGGSEQPAGDSGGTPPAGQAKPPEGCGGPTTPVPGQPKDYAPFVGPICSPDGSAAIVTAYIKGDGEADSLLDPVQKWRDTVSDPGEGLDVKVTGGAGYAADAIEVFTSINGTLLLAAVSLVIVLLIGIYRSPIFFLIPLIAVMFAELLSRSVGYGVSELGVTINGQSSSIMSILVLGAGTDYALLIVSRYREELHETEDRHEAMRAAIRSAGPAVFASAATVIAALLCLTLAKVNGTAGLGPIGAIGVACAALSMLTLLPALLVVFGRGAFWPFVPRYDPGHRTENRQGFWARVGDRVAKGPGRVIAGSILVLVVLCAGLGYFSTDLTTNDSYRTEVESVQGQEILAKAFPAGASAPADVIVQSPGDVKAVSEAVSAVDGVESVSPPVASGEQGTLVQATLEPRPYSTEAFDLVDPIRRAADGAAPNTLVGGASAVEFDVREAAASDSTLIPPIVLVVVLLILVVLLRSLVAPLVLIGTVIISFLAALGVGYFVFEVLFGFPGSDPSLPLFAFVFLVALGVDYNIFLVARAREETLKHGTREGMLRALAVTGGVITSAGIVLAGTFSVLAVLPLVFLTEIGFVVAFGVLLDTFLVRSVLVPALGLTLGKRFWWPSSLAKTDGDAAGGPTGGATSQPAAVQA